MGSFVKNPILCVTLAILVLEYQMAITPIITHTFLLRLTVLVRQEPVRRIFWVYILRLIYG